MAAKIAAEMYAAKTGGSNKSADVKPMDDINASPTKTNDPVVVGGSLVDLSYSVLEDNLQVS